MPRSQTQAGNLLFRAEQADKVAALSKFLSFFSGLAKKWTRADDKIAARYDGCVWCDSTERRLTHDIMTGSRNGF